jgi:6-phospho-beta-glucosidase
MLDRQGYAGAFVVSGDLDRTVEGADYVLVQIRVGGQEARLADETIPLACGCVGQETTGAGGLAKALRTVPVVLEIARRVNELSEAWVVDTRIRGHVTRALLDDGRRDRRATSHRLPAPVVGVARSRASRLVVDQIGLTI